MKHENINMSVERSKAYRYVWAIVYRMVRDTRTPAGDKVPFVGMAEIVAIFVRHYEVNETDLRDMLRRANDIIYYKPNPFSTLSEMRRAKLINIANGIEHIYSDFDDIPF